MKILLDTDPLSSGHADRGIGRYTFELRESLAKLPHIELTTDKTSPNIDLIHFPTVDLFSPTLPFVFNKPYIVTIHDLIPLRFPQHYPVGIKGKIYFLRQKLLIQRARVIITDSHESRADICRFLHISPAKVVVVPLGVSQKFKHEAESVTKPVLARSKIKSPYILYVGDINYNKNLPIFLESLTHLPANVNLVLVGKNFKPAAIPEWHSIQSTINEFNIKERVRFITDVPHSDQKTINSIFSQAAVYVQPSLVEGFGLPVLEAMACGCLVICSSTPALREVGGSVAYYAKPQVKDLAIAIKKVLSLAPSTKKEKRREGVAWSRGFTWQRTAAATALVYRKALQSDFN